MAAILCLVIWLHDKWWHDHRCIYVCWGDWKIGQKVDGIFNCGNTMCLQRSMYFFHFMFYMSDILTTSVFICPPVYFFFVYLPLCTKPSVYLPKKKKKCWEVIHPEIRIMVYMGKSCTPGTLSVNKHVVIPESLSC